MGRHEAPTSAPKEGTVLHMPSDVIEEARAAITARVAECLRRDPVTVSRDVGGVHYHWKFDRIDMDIINFGDQTGTVKDRW